MRLQKKIGEKTISQTTTAQLGKKLSALALAFATLTATIPYGAAFFATFAPSVAFAQNSVDVTATVDRNALNPTDTLTLTVSVRSSQEVTIGQPELPSLNDFEVLNEWTSQEARGSLVTTPNGPQFTTVRTTNHNFLLQPKREGTLSIGAVEVIVEGKAHLTKPISIRVAEGLSQQAPSRQQPGSNIHMPPFEEEEDDLFSQLLRRGLPPNAGGSRTLPINPNDAFFVQVDTDKTEAYVGEQITVSWYLYTRGQIRDLDTLKYPSLKGFWKEDIEIATHLNFTQEVVNGIPYKKALLASFALFPIKEGTSTIDSYTAKCTVLPAIDSMGGLTLGKPYSFTKSSQPIKITVKPLPTEGRPQDFSGAVGDFQLSAQVEEKNPVSNQPFNYKIRFEGKGNAKLIEMPPFTPPEGIEIYEQTNDAKFFRTGTSYKDFSNLLIAREPGQYTIPGISVSMFDPTKKQYVTKTTDPVVVNVELGQGPQAGGQSLSIDPAKSNAPKQDPAPKLLTEYKKPMALTPAQNAFTFSGVFGAIALLLLFQARGELGWGQKKKDLQRKLRARLRRVEAALARNDWRLVGVEMTNTVYFVLGEVSGEGGANMEFEKLMMKAPPSVRRELAEPLAKQMEVFQILSFAPEGVVGQLKDPERMKAAVNEMSKLMEQAVALGVSSGQSDESGSGPRAS